MAEERLPRVIIVHTYGQVVAALEAASELHTPLTLQSADGALFYAGGLYLRHMYIKAKALFPDVDSKFIVDCSEAGAEAVSAMESGHRHIRSTAPDELRTKLADIANQLDVQMVDGPYVQLDLLHAHDAKAACMAWLAKD